MEMGLTLSRDGYWEELSVSIGYYYIITYYPLSPLSIPAFLLPATTICYQLPKYPEWTFLLFLQTDTL